MEADYAPLFERLASRFEAGNRAHLKPLLRAIQFELFWLPKDALLFASEFLALSYPSVYEEASFNPEFSLEPKGRHVIAVCRGLSCSEHGSREVMKDYEKALGIREGETSPDRQFSLCTQHCFGQCAVGPNVKIGSQFLSRQGPGMAAEVVAKLLS